MSERLRVDMIKCDGHGYCAEIIPEMIQLDDWGYPMVSEDAVPQELMAHARRAVANCPLLALRLDAVRAPKHGAGTPARPAKA